MDPDGREDFYPEEKDYIIYSQNKTITNLDSIIERLNHYRKGTEDKELYSTCMDYLGLDINKPNDLDYLINSLNLVKNDLETMTIDDYKKNTNPFMSKVTYRITTIEGKQYVTYNKTIYLGGMAVIKDLEKNITFPLHAQLVHETTHKVLGTKDIKYKSDGYNLCNDILKAEKKINADNWTEFYYRLVK